MFEIGLSLVLRLHLHLLLYYKVQQQIEMDELVSNIHPVSRSNWSYYNHHHRCCCCCCSDFICFIVCWCGGLYRLDNILFRVESIFVVSVLVSICSESGSSVSVSSMESFLLINKFNRDTILFFLFFVGRLLMLYFHAVSADMHFVALKSHT